MEKNRTNKKLWILAAVVVALIAAFLLTYQNFAAKPAAGAKELSISIVHGDGSGKELTLHTDQEYLRGALEEENLISGTEEDFGLYVLTVDGETADEGKQQWWMFTKGGEQLNTGVDMTIVQDSEAYEITLKTGW
ncbi:MAG TPA: DUF4430 domain-containing protein [Feifaniaceae bacterium]|nr:DUF4430 domain-containing protein [Feifaniaceae bacterium]